MNKPIVQPNRSELPAGWEWADWSNAQEARRAWDELDRKLKQGLRQRFMQISVCIGSSRPFLHKTMAYYDKGSGIGFAKVLAPNPGCRACFFRDGNTHYVALITMKDDSSAERQKNIEAAQVAKAEHAERKLKPKWNQPR